MPKGREGIPEYWLELIADTLKQVDISARGAFLQKFLQSLVGRWASEEESITHWEGILARQSQWAEKLGHPVALRTAVVDYFEGLSILRNPVFLEYEELKQLRYNAATDSLTGLNNRRMFEEYLGQEIDRATRYGYPFALLSFDLRNFKSVNDTFGHAAGDEMLRSFAHANRETVRGSDIPCRMGGDEFATLLPQADRPGAQVLADRIARKFEEHARSMAPGAPVGVDYGIAIFPEEGHDVASMIAAADRRLYANKAKAHERSAASMVLPQVSAAPAAEPAHPVKVEHDHPEVDRPLFPPAPAVSAGISEKVQISESGPNGRRFERTRVDGTLAQGLVRIGRETHTVKVLDASRVGVGILIDKIDLPETFRALLHVPSLSGHGELALQRIYSLPLADGKRRVGCVLTSYSGPR
ncbi:MAG: GGDEF domain-containing protein [Terriglobia bacterium]